MDSKKLKFASVLMCAAFAPQAVGASAAQKDDVASKYRKYMNSSMNGAIIAKGASSSDGLGEEDDGDDDFSDFDQSENKSRKIGKRGFSSRKKGLISKAFNTVSSFFTARRYRNMRGFLKKIAIFGGLGYCTINFVPQIAQKVMRKSSVGSNFYSEGISSEIWNLMQNPSVDFSFVIGDGAGTDEKSKEKAKKSIKDVATFLESFERAYNGTGGNISMDSFKSDINYGENWDEAVKYCTNISHLDTGGIAKILNPKDAEKMKKQLDMIVNYETKRIADAALKGKEGSYHGIGKEGSEDFKRAMKLMWEGGKKAGIQVGGVVLSGLGGPLMMSGHPVIGILASISGALLNYFNQENQKKDSQQQVFSGS